MLIALLYMKHIQPFIMPTSEQVHLRVYDLLNGNAPNLAKSLFGIHLDGIWHTSIEIFNTEYFFASTGVHRMEIGTTGHGPCIRRIKYGETTKTRSEFEAFLVSIGDRFNGNSYNLFNNNCNNFSNELLLFLVNQCIEKEILDLPNVVTSAMMRNTKDNL